MDGEDKAFGDEESEVGDEAGEAEPVRIVSGSFFVRGERHVHVGAGEADASKTFFGVEADPADKVGRLEGC